MTIATVATTITVINQEQQQWPKSCVHSSAVAAAVVKVRRNLRHMATVLNVGTRSRNSINDYVDHRYEGLDVSFIIIGSNINTNSSNNKNSRNSS